MSLSDDCFEFIQAVGDAATKLAREARRYTDADYPLHYGGELNDLILAAEAVAKNPADAVAVQALAFRAEAIREFHDTPPPEKSMAAPKT